MSASKSSASCSPHNRTREGSPPTATPPRTCCACPESISLTSLRNLLPRLYSAPPLEDWADMALCPPSLPASSSAYGKSGGPEAFRPARVRAVAMVAIVATVRSVLSEAA